MRTIVLVTLDGEPSMAFTDQAEALAHGQNLVAAGRQVDLSEISFFDTGPSAAAPPALTIRRRGETRHPPAESDVIRHVPSEKLPAHLRPPVPVANVTTKPCGLGCGRMMNASDPKTYCDHCAAELAQVVGWPSNPPAPPTPGAEFK